MNDSSAKASIVFDDFGDFFLLLDNGVILIFQKLISIKIFRPQNYVYFLLDLSKTVLTSHYKF